MSLIIFHLNPNQPGVQVNMRSTNEEQTVVRQGKEAERHKNHIEKLMIEEEGGAQSKKDTKVQGGLAHEKSEGNRDARCKKT